MKVSLLSLPGRNMPGTRTAQKFLFSMFFVLLSYVSFSQVVGDYRSTATGNWSSASTWQTWDGDSWETATTYPGEIANSQTVTIKAGTVVSLDVAVTAFTIGDLVIEGTGRLNLSGSTTWELNAQKVHVVSDGVYAGPNFTFAGSQAALRLPANSFISFPPGYGAFPTSNVAPNGSCNNNNALYLGGGSFGLPQVKYSACNGGGNVCVLFNEINDAGGTIHVEPSIELASDVLGAGNQSCRSTFAAFIRIKDVIDNGQVSLQLSVSPSGSVTPNTLTALTDGGAADLGPAGDQEILVQVSVTTPGPGAYTLNASATLTLIAASGSCSNFTSTTSNSAPFNVLPAPSVSVTAPTSICIGETGTVTLTNNTSIGTTVYFNLNGSPALSVAIAGSASGSIFVPNAIPVSYTYTIDSVKYTSAPGCKQDVGTTHVISVGDALFLANDGDTKTQNILLAPVITASQGCRVIAKVEAAGLVTDVNAKAFVSPGGAPIVYSGRPMVGRRVAVHPVVGSGGAATFTIYAYQSEFTAFNNSPIKIIDLPYTPADPEGFASNVRVIKFEEGNFDINTGLPTGNVQATGTEIVPTSVTYNNAKGWWEIKFPVTSFSLFIISNTTFWPLPLKLISFDAKLSGKRTAALSWTTSEERNVRSFDVEASKDGRLFSKVGEVDARNTVASGTYNFSTPMPGKLGYFRLRMIDKNGAFSYSPVKALKSDDLIITSYPNPVTNQLIVDLTGYPAGTMRIVDMSGRTLSNIKTVDGINRVNTSALGSGMYILQVNVGLESENLKFSKVQ